ncbi:MAG TPA: GPP34 family phosphoprotein [Mycobacteriales bacterium]|nr:GPP34 family phosphoprotein [Mycobacteriales bacterium]
MELPESLPARLYLLACDTRKERLTNRSMIGHALRAAALTDLLLTGQLADKRGKAVVADRTPPGGPMPRDPMPRDPVSSDPVLAAVLAEIRAGRPRSWKRWVRTGARPTRDAVRDQLMAGRWIRVEQHRILGLFPTARITLRQPTVVSNLHRRVRTILVGAQPASRVDPRDAALVALAAAGELRTVLTRAQRREHKRRISQLTEASGPAVAALRKVVQELAASAVGAG